MSERGSFITQFVYCHDCREQMAILFKDMSKDGYFCPNPLGENYSDGFAPIYGGQQYDSYGGGEIHNWEVWRETIEGMMCHDLDVAVMSESPETRQILRFIGRKKNEQAT